MTTHILTLTSSSNPEGVPSHPSTNNACQAEDEIWSLVQRGLVYPSPYAVFVTFFRRADAKQITKRRLGLVWRKVRAHIHKEFGNAHTTAILGVGFRLWAEISAGALPKGMELKLAPQVAGATRDFESTVFSRSGSVFKNSGADLWFHIKSDKEDHCKGVLNFVRKVLEEEEGWMVAAKTIAQSAATKSNEPDKRGGKVLGGRFSENLNNATDPLTIQENTIVGLEDPEHRGASFVLTQRFYFNWEQIVAMSPQHVEDLVGRKTDDTLIPSHDDRSHIRRARMQDAEGNTTPILRLGLPFGTSTATANNTLLSKGASRGNEAGIYFAGLAKSAAILEAIMDRQIGDTPGTMADRLLAHVHSDLGGFFYIPSLTDLELPPMGVSLFRKPLDQFPGIDWNRLDRHFSQASANGYMHYNHKEYLFRMATMAKQADRQKYRPPSCRVLSLLSDAFSRWQDNWYFDRAQSEMKHLRYYLERDYGTGEAERIMSLSIAERGGWAAKILLGRVLVSEDYGFRGRRTDANGNVTNGADTYRINPDELLVGAMPNLGLGQGKHLIDFARDDEQLGNFFDNLSYASGVGHIVPQFSVALRIGIAGLLADVIARRDNSKDEKQRQFYAGTALALEGVVDHCRAFARLAEKRAAELSSAFVEKRQNLLAIRDRMNALAVRPPATLLEATQLIFTLHSCIHHVGEPTAIGRLDQLLLPFYAKDRLADLNEDQAQEIIDCFWIKLGEKVQLNRQFIEDHQVFGNLAMGGASGNYPQGSSINQWIQQVTVGGTVADDAPGDGHAAYNDVTLLCLRAARRLPLNAPCLSLRMRPDIPAQFVHEAALAILSGGAHPILLSDAKIIPGLKQSGDRVGDGKKASAATPVAEKAGGRWQSTVALKDARDYAADGCYEPQLSGTSWFTLGGMVSTLPLEAALNQGKSWQSAGPVWFRGQKVSFTSAPATEIKSFEELVELYFKHLKWMYAKQLDGQISIFGRMNSVCPAPLLSVFVDDCLDKGLDYYEGGPRYNVIAPCFTGLSTLIDSLWAIRYMVFDPATAITSLSELVDALRCDWGENMAEPFISKLQGPARIAARAERYRRLRVVAMGLPKYGRGCARKDSHGDTIDSFGDKLIGRVAETAVSTFTDPAERTAESMLKIAMRLGTPERPFGGFQIQPGVGTFENYLDWGNMSGASADGRRSGDPLASDLSPAPSYGDQPIDAREAPFLNVMEGYKGLGVARMWDGAPTDFNIREDFSPVDLESVLRRFAEGDGSSIMTITCANAETFAGAVRDPEKYDLLRVRMGGWSEFFVAMFPAHQEQHQRRPVNTPGCPFHQNSTAPK